MELRGRTVLLTGASGGLARHIAAALAREGARIVLSARRRDALDELAAHLPGEGHVGVVADLSDREQALALPRLAEEAAGPIDVLVNNAGIELTKPYLDLTDDDLDRMIAVNLTAPMLLTRAVLPGMLQRGRGHVVMMASVAGKVGVSCNEPYAATKAGLIGLTRSLREEFRDRPVGFSVISPGFIARDGMYERMEREAGVHAPPLVGAVDPEKVAAATVRAIRRDLPDVTINGTPIAPMLALAPLSPRLFERTMRLGRVNEMFERVAARRGNGGER